MLTKQFRSTEVRSRSLRFACAATFVLIIALGANSVRAYAGEDVVVGTVEKIDAEGKKMYVKTKDGAVRIFKWTKKTTTHGIEAARVWTDHAQHKGAHVVLRVGKEGGEDVIKGLHWFGAGVAHVVESSVRHIGKGANKVEIAVEDKGKEVYEISEHAIVKAGSKVWHKTKDVESNSIKEVKAIVHYVERDGKKVVHYVEHKLDK